MKITSENPSEYKEKVGTDIFLTGTFRNEWSKSFNSKLAALLEAEGVSVHLPQRDSEQQGDRKTTFVEDVKGVENAKVLLAIGLRTQTANWGFEIGYAYKSGKPIIIVVDSQTPVELMPEGAASEIVSVDDIENDQELTDKILPLIRKHLT